MNHPIQTALAAALLLAQVAQAQSYSITFDSLNSGTPANLAAPIGVSFGEGTWSPDYDSDGDAIQGTERWRLFDGASPILVRNPTFYDRGSEIGRAHV